jgi:GntR family transcriptional regulator of arabinose operon
MRAKSRDGKDAYKYAQIKTDLSIQILEGQLRPHDRVPSLNEIAQKYRVSKITARRVLNDLVTDGLVYTSRGRGSFVADAPMRSHLRKTQLGSNQLGVVFEHATGSFMGDIILGIDEEAFSRNAQINLCISNNSYEREAENLQRLAQQGIDKILMFMVLKGDDRAINPNIPLYLRLQERGIKILLLACNIPGFPIPSIVYDDYNAFRSLVTYMKDKGRRRLAYATRVDNASTTSERFRGFKDALLQTDLPYDEKRIVCIRLQNYDTIVSDAREQFGKFLAHGEPIDAVVCTDEMVAAGVFEALDGAGIPPRDMPLVGGMGSHRNLHVLRGHPYVLLEDDTRRLGREAARAMLQDELPDPGELNYESFRRVIPAPLRPPRRKS